MVKKVEKANGDVYVYYEVGTTFLELLIGLIPITPVLAFCIGFRALHGWRPALTVCWKYSAIIIPILLLLFAISMLCCCRTVVFGKDSISYRKWVFKKNWKSIPLDTITNCIISHGLWEHQGSYVMGRKIFLFHNNKIIQRFELHGEIMQQCINKLHDDLIWVVGDDNHLQSLGSYYKNVNYASLSLKEQSALSQHYCKLMKSKERDANIILKKKI